MCRCRPTTGAPAVPARHHHVQPAVGHGAPGGRARELEVSAVPSSVGRGRRWTTRQAGDLGACTETQDVVELLVSEVLTNAVLHSPAEASLHVQVDRVGDDVRVAICDTGDRVPAVRSATTDDLGGRGMSIVDVLARAWGVERHASDGKCVWFTVSLEAATAD